MYIGVGFFDFVVWNWVIFYVLEVEVVGLVDFDVI